MSWTGSVSGEEAPSLPISPHNHPLNPNGPTSERRLQRKQQNEHSLTCTAPQIQTPAHTRWQITRQSKNRGEIRLCAYHEVISNVWPLQLKPALFHVGITIRTETNTHSVFVLLTSIVKYCLCNHGPHASSWILQVEQILISAECLFYRPHYTCFSCWLPPC